MAQGYVVHSINVVFMYICADQSALIHLPKREREREGERERDRVSV